LDRRARSRPAEKLGGPKVGVDFHIDASRRYGNRRPPANLRFDRPRGFAKAAVVLVEYRKVRQVPGQGLRRWFEGHLYELVVWYRPDEKTVAGFQILYRLNGRERALTWREGEGFDHAQVDSGTQSPLKNLTPILLPDGSIPWPRVLQEFDEGSGALEPELRDFVRRRLEAQA
jgi:hypothetical protein